MDRRRFLRSALVAVLGGGGLLAACGRDEGGIPGGQPSLSVFNGSYELLSGPDRRVVFGLHDLDNAPIRGADVRVYLREPGGRVLAGPVAARYAEIAEGLGVYRASLDLESAGTPYLVAVHGDAYGEAALNVVAADDSVVPVPGAPAISAATPTPDDDQGVDRLCTRSPACGMHATSLDRALADGRPVALLFATPAYCRTAVCGPAVSTVEGIRRSGDWGDLAFVHVEVFRDAGVTLTEATVAWGLPNEPWLFTIGRDGRLVDRMDGPMIPDEVAALISRVAA